MDIKKNFANDMLHKRDFRSALRSYLDMLEIDPNDSLAYQGIAQCYYELKDYENAAAACRKAIEADRTLALPYTTLSAIYLRQKNFEAAFTEATKAYAISPKL